MPPPSPVDLPEVLTRSSPPPTRTVVFGPAEHQRYDVYAPGDTTAGGLEGEPTWVVLVHGGFWRPEFDRVHQRPLAAALAQAGYAVAHVEYRRPGMPGGGWPGTGADLLAATREVLSRERPRRWVAVGHSAGGQLALWLAHQGLPGLGGVVPLAGCLDLRLVNALELDEDAAPAFLGGTPEQVPSAYAEADPALLGRCPVAVVTLHGTEDDRVPIAVTRSWWSAAADPARDRRVELDGVDHFALIDPLAPAFGVLLDQLATLAAAMPDGG